MGIFDKKPKPPLYYAAENDIVLLSHSTNDQLEKWAADANCLNRDKCANLLEKRKKQYALKRETLEENPFDPRTEISADAKHIASRIVTHMWIILVVLPIVLGILYEILK